MQAVILAAGMGKRLKELTGDVTKCMVKVNGVSLIERMLCSIERQRFSKIVIVTGYQGQKLKDYIATLNIKTPIEYIDNNIYNKTNNIYSLYLAKDRLLEEDTVLFESDLIFEDAVLEKLVNNKAKTLALVAKYEPWMDGTVVTLDRKDNILKFVSKNEFSFCQKDSYYKTVNIYKFSKEFSRSHYVPFLEAYCKALGNNEYYEQVLKVIALLDKPAIKAVRLQNEIWYEIDDIQDLNIAESLFASGSEKLEKFQVRYGGYWRYPHMLDFCYLVNPYFPPPKMVEEMLASFKELLCNYPSGMDINSLLAAKCFSLKKENVVVGNGAAEIIKSLMEYQSGKLGIPMPTFQEYPNRKNPCDVVAFVPQNPDYSYTAEDLIGFYKDKDIQALAVVNPDNPSGNFIDKNGILKLCDFCKEKNIRFILDESFVDFADTPQNSSMLDTDLLNKYKNLIVVKSISKSYGVPGIRLGIAASGDTELIASLKKDVAIWNINSFGEFFFQIYEKYASCYGIALGMFKEARRKFAEKLAEIKSLRVIPSQANYIMCEVLPSHSSAKLTEQLLTKHNILIKDLSTKKGFDGKSYVRLAVRDNADNDALVAAIKSILQ